jgi:HK97 family phage prohead protease
MKIERRTFRAELRKSADGRKIRGTAVVFNQRSQDLGGYVEQIEPAAFDGCDMSDVRCLFNHNDDNVLGRTKSGTLRITRDSNGVCFDCDPPDTGCARDLASSMDRGDIDQCSFSFTVPPGGAVWSEDKAAGVTVRTVKKISRLWDVSVVTYPAYPQTSSEIRTNAEILSEQRPAAPTAPCGAVDYRISLDHARRKMELARALW